MVIILYENTRVKVKVSPMGKIIFSVEIYFWKVNNSPDRWDTLITKVVINFLSNSLSYSVFEIFDTCRLDGCKIATGIIIQQCS